MNSTMSSFFFLLSLITFCLALQPHLISAARQPAPQLSPLVTKACSQAPNINLCISTLNSDPENVKKNLTELAFLAFDRASNVSTANNEFISQSLSDADGSDEPDDSVAMQAFADCQEVYEGAVDEIDNSISALVTGPNKGQIETLLKDAIAAVETCQKSVKGQGGKEQQLFDMNNSLLDLLNNAVSVYHVCVQK